MFFYQADAALKYFFQLTWMIFQFMQFKYAQFQQRHSCADDLYDPESHDGGSGVDAKYHSVCAQFSIFVSVNNSSSKTIHKGISLSLKALIVIASCWYIYTKVFH